MPTLRFLALLLVCVVPVLAAEPEPKTVLYRGAGGIELQYPPTWSRAVFRDKVPPGQRILLISPGKPADRMVGHRVLGSVEKLPAADRNPMSVARLAAESWKRKGTTVVEEPADATLGKVPVVKLVMERTDAQKQAFRTIAYYVPAGESVHLLDVECAASDVRGLTEGEAILQTLIVSDARREPDGTSTLFLDRHAGIAFERPSHWEDYVLGRTMLASYVSRAPDNSVNAIIMVFPPQGNADDLDKMATDVIGGLSSTVNDLKVLDRVRRKTDDGESLELVTSGTSKSDKSPMSGRVLLLPCRGQIVIISAGGKPAEAEQARKELDQIRTTFRPVRDPAPREGAKSKP